MNLPEAPVNPRERAFLYAPYQSVTHETDLGQYNVSPSPMAY